MSEEPCYTEEDYKEVLSILRELVTSLDKTYWSSWQSTAKFDEHHQLARDYLLTFDGEYHYE